MLYLAAIAFELCVANRYKLNKAYEKLKAKSAAKPDDLTLKTQCLQAEVSGQVAYGICYTNFLCCSAYSSTCSRVDLTHCNCSLGVFYEKLGSYFHELHAGQG